MVVLGKIQEFPSNSVYAPAIRLQPRKEKNVFQRIIEWIGSCFCRAKTNWQTRRDVQHFFKKRVEVWKEVRNPTVAKTVELIQRFLTNRKAGVLERSCFVQLGMATTKLMDPVYLDIALHQNVDEYVANETKRFQRYCNQTLQRAFKEILERSSHKIGPEMTLKVERLIEKAAELSAEDLEPVIAELTEMRIGSKLIEPLKDMLALLKIEPAFVASEIESHYLATLQIHEKRSLEALPAASLARGEIRALEILSKRLVEPGVFQDANENTRLQRFLEGAVGNLDLNQRLLRYAKAPHFTISKQALEFVLEISYKMTRGEEYCAVMKKVEKLNEAIDTFDFETTADERLSLKELRQVESLARLHARFEDLTGCGFEIDHSLVGLSKAASVFLEKVLEQAEHERPCKSGSVIFYDYPNARDYHNQPGGCFRRFIYNHCMQWPLVHAALGIGKGTQNMISHMWRGDAHVVERRSIGDYVFKTFEIDFSKLASQKGKEVLQRILGDSWEAEVERIYGEITNQVHTNRELLAKFSNSCCDRVLASLVGTSCQTAPWDNRAREHRTVTNQQICSSFVLNMSLEAMVHLEERLKEACNARRGQDEDPIPDGFRFLKLPLRKNRMLNFVLPHQLARRGLAFSREIDPPPVIAQVLNFHHYEMY